MKSPSIFIVVVILSPSKVKGLDDGADLPRVRDHLLSLLADEFGQ
jgi:hypothetical protein